MSDSHLIEFATRYTAAWCSHNASSVATFYSESGSLSINEGKPAVGRQAVEAAAQSFMTAYPDLVVKFDRLEPKNERVRYHWTFIGTNTGPGGTGNEVRISGYEDWKIAPDGLIADSKRALRRARLGSASQAAVIRRHVECPVTIERIYRLPCVAAPLLGG